MIKLVEHAALVASLLGVAALALYLAPPLRRLLGSNLSPTDESEIVRRAASSFALVMVACAWLAFPAAFLSPRTHRLRVVGLMVGMMTAVGSVGMGERLERWRLERTGAGTRTRVAVVRVVVFFGAAAALRLAAARDAATAVVILGIGALCLLAAWGSRPPGAARRVALRMTCFAGASLALVLLALVPASGGSLGLFDGIILGATGVAPVLSGAAWVAVWRAGRSRSPIVETLAIVGVAAGLLSAQALSLLVELQGLPV